MNHSSRSDQIYPQGYVPFQLDLGNGLLHSINNKTLNQQVKNENHSKTIKLTRTINTGIVYLSLPEPKLQVTQPQQWLNIKNQIQRDFSLRFHYLNDYQLNQMLSTVDKIDAHRYINSYRHLYHCVLESTLKTVNINEEISQLKHSITYTDELLPILEHNRKLAKHEKKILYNIVTKTWQRFDERMQNEIHAQYLVDQFKQEHDNLTHEKTKQEEHRAYYIKINEISNEIMSFKREIQHLYAYRCQLEDEIHEMKIRCSHSISQRDYLKTNLIRHLTNELNSLQSEYDSTLTQTEIKKYNLVKQIQFYDNILNNYRTDLNNFRLTLSELEQDIKQQIDNELQNIQISNIFPHQSINDDINKLISVLENKVGEKQLANTQLNKSIDDLRENILLQKQLLVKKENDYRSMDFLEQQINQNINIYRQSCLTLKTEFKPINRQLKLKLKQYNNDRRQYQSLIEHYDLLLNQKKLEQAHANTFIERVGPLLNENNELKVQLDDLNRQCTKINATALIDIRLKVNRLKQIHKTFVQQNVINEHARNHQENTNEQLYIKITRLTGRINSILQRIKQQSIDSKINNEHIQMLENKLDEDQHHYLQSKYVLTELIKNSDSHRNKQQMIRTQIQIVLNNITHSQFRSKSFDEQLSICRRDLAEQHTSLNRIREFHFKLKQQHEVNLKEISKGYAQLAHSRNQYKILQKSLRKTNDDLKKYSNARSILGRMVVRRINLCQLLYKKLAHIDNYIHQRDQTNEMILKCIQTLKIHIRQKREQNKKLIENKDKYKNKVMRIHIDKVLDRSHEKQRLFIKQIFQRRLYRYHSLTTLPCEESTYLKTKLCMLKNRLIKVVCRGIICNLVLISIQKEFSNLREQSTTKLYKENTLHFNSLRANLYKLMRQLKAKTAEHNMFVDYKCYLQLIHTDTIQQLVQWKSFVSNDNP